MKLAFLTAAIVLCSSANLPAAPPAPVAAPPKAPAVAAPAAAPPAKTDNPLQCNQQTASGLGYTILTAGSGEPPTGEDAVSVNYTGRLATNGTEFDSSKDTKFAVGGVIPGFGEGLLLMRPGATYRLCIPAALGYAERAVGEIPPGSDLVFEVELLSVIKKPAPVVRFVPEAERTCNAKTASGLGYQRIKDGTGISPADDDVVLVNIAVYEAASGKILDERDWQQIPIQGAQPAVGEGLKLMNLGSSFRFCVPAALLGRTAAEGQPPPVDINFHIELIDKKKISDIR